MVAAPRPHRAQVRTSSSDAHEVSQQVIDEPSGRPRTGVTRRPRLPRRSAEWRAGRTRSLTVVRPLDDGFTVALIPHTAEVTTLGHKGPGDTVNLEVDVMAKYTERLLAGHLPVPSHTENGDAPGARPDLKEAH